MLIHKIEKTHFSPSEAVVIDYILKNGEQIKNMTTASIAQETFTSPPLLIRIAKKLGYSGWNAFKEAYLEELNYLYANRQVDASIPFVVSDDIMTIAQNICILESETIQDTLALLHHDDLQKAMQLIRKTKEIDIYAVSTHIYLAETFRQKMYRIEKNVNLCRLTGDAKVQVAMSTPEKCAILISYSGRTPFIVDVAKKLKQKGTPVIAITSIADNDLSKISDATLRMSSREMIHTKIGDFASTQSVKCLLDILYACIFSMDYQKNLDYRIRIAKEINQQTSNDEQIDEE
ncbi:MAG: MurR/RpiR family transcriptional regulator [Longibaculum sp.]